MMSFRQCQGLSLVGSGTGGVQRSIALRFIAMSISMYWLVVVMLTCPSQDLMTLILHTRLKQMHCRRMAPMSFPT